MKRSLIALPVIAAASMAAHAQSSVMVYGLVDVALEHLTQVGAGQGRLMRMPGLSGSVPSRLGFRGAEDLGGGWKAVFTLESGFGLDTGSFNQGGRAMGRQAFTGVSGPWGSLTLGRQYSMLYWSQLDADILGPHAHGSGSLDSYLPNARVDNAIAYQGRFSGLMLGATYSLGRDAVNAGPSPSGTNCAGESATDPRACRQWSMLAKYDTENWGIAGAVDEVRGGAAAFAGLTSSALKDRRSTLTAWAKLGAFKLGAGWIGRDNGGSPATPRSHLGYVGAAYYFTSALVLEGQVLRLDYRHSRDAATLYAVRATYTLSKRTAVYASAGHIANQGGLALSVSGAAAGGAPVAGGGQTGVTVGVRHMF